MVEQRVQRKKDTFEIVRYYTLLYKSELKGSKLNFISFWPKFGKSGGINQHKLSFSQKTDHKE